VDDSLTMRSGTNQCSPSDVIASSSYERVPGTRCSSRCLISHIPASLSNATDGYSRGPWDSTHDRIKDKVERGILWNQSLLVAVNLSRADQTGELP